ncbi:hypothetical protein HOI83_02170 [Candidatus Uhrbacteria bacterium]|nr:hypothetical protein [Candidatus Uhrbacteria bacterium]
MRTVTTGSQAARLYVCIGRTKKETLAIVVEPENVFRPPGGVMYMRTLQVLERYFLSNGLWLALERHYGELFDSKDVSAAVLLLRWINGTIAYGAGLGKGDDKLTGDMDIPEIIDAELLRNPELVILLWDIGKALIHDARSHGFRVNVPGKRPKNEALQMKRVLT